MAGGLWVYHGKYLTSEQHLSRKLKPNGTIENINIEIDNLGFIVKSARDLILNPKKNSKKTYSTYTFA